MNSIEAQSGGAGDPLDPDQRAEIRASMGVASEGDQRGQRDTIGFAVDAMQMAACVDAASAPPRPIPLAGGASGGESGPVLGAICPHDDYLYAGRVYRDVLAHVRAPLVVIIGVFHSYRRLGVRGRVGFEAYRSWRSPDGPIEVSALREAWRARLRPEDHFVSNACHDAEHSIEAIAYWLRHGRPDRTILPLLAPAERFDRISELARRAGSALGAVAIERGLLLGRDLAVVISADAVHYGADFEHTPFGDRGAAAHEAAVARDLALLHDLSGEVTSAKVERFFEALVDPAEPDRYRIPWCGRFSIPFGLLLLRELRVALGQPLPLAVPLVYGTSIDPPRLNVASARPGVTAPADEAHFVGHPGVLLVAP
ncbi:MAG: AmmeMemoRadiSam system protein B [Candidatus Eisenbacteria bacterium]|nr:AmmeMemoRadiSam system protein B [Candidatus Eisenbacteria bacterium]